MLIADITKAAGRSRKRKRIGRGPGSGHGKTSGRGTKGGGSRAGWKSRSLAEGGALPLFRRIPKRGFSNVQFTTRYNIVNVGELESAFEKGSHVTAAALLDAGLIRRRGLPVKVLGDGSLTKAMRIEAARFSDKAREKIEAAGGTVAMSEALLG